MINWSAVQTAYTTTDKSYAQLGREFGVSASMVARRGKAENWPKLRAEHAMLCPEHEDKYAHLLRASRQLDRHLARILSDGDKLGPREVTELSRAIKTALEIRRELADRLEGPTQLTITFAHPEWAE